MKQDEDRMGSGLLGYGLGESPRPLVLSVSWDEDWGGNGVLLSNPIYL